MKYLKLLLGLLRSNSAILSSISSIFLAYMALIVSIKTCDIAEHQNRLTEIGYSPHFKIECHLERNNKTGIYDRELMTIENTGYPISEVNSEYKTYFVMTLTPKDVQAQQLTVVLPVVSYFSITYPTNQQTGLLFTIAPDFDNNLKMGAFEFKTRQIEKTRFQFHNLELVRLVRISYKSKLGLREAKYFKVDAVNGGIELTEQQYERIDVESKSYQNDRGFIEFDECDFSVIEKVVANQ